MQMPLGNNINAPLEVNFVQFKIINTPLKTSLSYSTACKSLIENHGTNTYWNSKTTKVLKRKLKIHPKF